MDINELKEEYRNIDIPRELEYVVKSTIHKKEKNMKRKNIMSTIVLSAAAICVLFIGSVNISPSVANAMSDVPGIKHLVSLVSFRELTYADDSHEAKVEIPKVEGLENTNLQTALNDKYKEENTKLYEDFVKGIDNNDPTPANLALFTNYKILVQTDDFMAVQGIKTEIAASGSESATYDNIDLKNQLIITLPSLFKDDDYIDVISANIIQQMKDQMANSDVMYFLAENGDQGGFDKITAKQNFYINADGKLVIAFDEYAVAPGYMGMIDFVIPTDVIQDLLVSNAYVK